MWVGRSNPEWGCNVAAWLLLLLSSAKLYMMLLEWNRLLLQRVVAESCYCVMLWESGILYLPRKPVVKTTSLWKQTPLIGASFPHIKKDLLRTSNKEYLVGCQSLQTHKNQLLWLITRKLMLWSWFLYKLLATSSRGVSPSPCSRWTYVQRG